MYNQICPYFNKMFQCGFYKGFNAQHHLLLITGKWRVVLDNVRETGAALTDLFKALGWINQNLIIAKLNAYGAEKISLDFIHYYLTKRKKKEQSHLLDHGRHSSLGYNKCLSYDHFCSISTSVICFLKHQVILSLLDMRITVLLTPILQTCKLCKTISKKQQKNFFNGFLQIFLQ